MNYTDSKYVTFHAKMAMKDSQMLNPYMLFVIKPELIWKTVSITLRKISIDSNLSESKLHSFLKRGFNDKPEGLRILRIFFAFVDFQSIFQWKYPGGI